MTELVFSLRLLSRLAAAGIVTREDLNARQADLERLGLTALDARRVRFALLRANLAEDAHGVPAQVPAAAVAGPLAYTDLERLPALLTAREAADFLRVNRRTVANWCFVGTIAAYRLGDDWRIARAEMLKLLESQRETAA